MSRLMEEELRQSESSRARRRIEDSPGHEEQTGWPSFRNRGKLPKTIFTLYSEKNDQEYIYTKEFAFFGSLVYAVILSIEVYSFSFKN